MKQTNYQKGGQTRKPRCELVSLFAVFAALVMATGPGVLLVNRPDTILGLPIVYAWGILWYFVICGIALVTDHFIWSKDKLKEEHQDESR